ncbi:CHAD domain-containing protein [Aporhodopirellula aestuarii]|uniref:CHAD domain-containing protein n=1 Tax=Aporhodopirellula aestuarii TaxID=2950107 RepID=A0ABT0U8C6_9BACT|nr:CHAD domain-containing protein [Aporhodopirellula aestuarii]MCM2372939.1 CHAD domain-containing protein [Aporhodopirellula aestuarii]
MSKSKNPLKPSASNPTDSADSPVSLVAKESIQQRLKSAWACAPKAAKRADKNVEHVHQLRVGVRRANAALELYAPLLPRKTTISVEKQLRSLRKAAGPARDLDILQQRLLRCDADQREPGVDDLLAFIQSRRIKAQRLVKRAYVHAKQDEFDKTICKLVKGVKWRGKGKEPNFDRFAHDRFEPMVARFFAAGESDLSDIEALHELRIEGKTVRYAMGLLTPAFGKTLQKQTSVFVKLQNKLGLINDHASAIDFYRKLLSGKDSKGCKKTINQMIQWEVAALESSRTKFMKWWTPERIAEMRQQFATFLIPSDEPIQ